MATFTEELGKLAAEAMYKREKKVEEEKGRLRPHLEQQWKMLRVHALNAAKEGNTVYEGTMTTDACKFTVFKPNGSNLRAALPDELKALNNSKGPAFSFFHGTDTLAPAFEIVIHFASTAAESLLKLKRDRVEAEENDKEEEEATAKRVKVEQN